MTTNNSNDTPLMNIHRLPEWLRSSRPAAAPERSALAADKSAEDEHQDSALSADGDDGRADGSDNNNNNGNSNSLEGSPERGVAEEKVQDECLNSHSGTRPSVSIQSMPSGADRRVVKHTVRFRGSRWKNLLNKKPGALEFAVKADISHACNIDTEFILSRDPYPSYFVEFNISCTGEEFRTKVLAGAGVNSLPSNNFHCQIGRMQEEVKRKSLASIYGITFHPMPDWLRGRVKHTPVELSPSCRLSASEPPSAFQPSSVSDSMAFADNKSGTPEALVLQDAGDIRLCFRDAEPSTDAASCAGRTPSKEVAPAGRTEETDNNKFKSCRSVSTQSSVERACSLEKHIIRFSGDGWKQVKCEGGTGIAFEREAHSSQKLSSDVSLMCDLYVCGVRLTTASFERKCCNSIGFHQCD